MENQIGREINLTHTYDAPRELVFRAFTDARLLAEWWGPTLFTNPVCEVDARPGGALLIHMRGPDGVIYPCRGSFKEVSAPERIVFIASAFEDQDHRPIVDILNTVTLSEHNGKTQLRLHAVVVTMVKSTPEIAAALDGWPEGWRQSFDKLARTLPPSKGAIPMTKTMFIAEPGKQELFIHYTFDAPRERVFNAYTDPTLIPQWWGPRYLTTTIDRMEAKTGGSWRFIQRDGEGHEFAFHGVYHDVRPPLRIVDTFEFEGTPGHVLLETATFEEQAGQTRLTVQVVYQSVEDRDEMLAAGAEQGMAESMQRLAELLTQPPWGQGGRNGIP